LTICSRHLWLKIKVVDTPVNQLVALEKYCLQTKVIIF